MLQGSLIRPCLADTFAYTLSNINQSQYKTQENIHKPSIFIEKKRKQIRLKIVICKQFLQVLDI